MAIYSTRKLTPAMETLVGFLSDGWELACSNGMRPYFWMQERLGEGGASITVSAQIVAGLFDRHLLRPEGRAPGLGTKYVLR